MKPSFALVAVALATTLLAPSAYAQRPGAHVAVATAGVAQGDRDRDKVFDDLESALARTRANQKVEVIVRYASRQSWMTARSDASVRTRLDADQSVVVRLSPAQVRHLAASGAVSSIESNETYHALRDTAGTSFGATQARTDFGLTGDGDGDPTRYSARDLTIAVIDSGIDAGHPDFAGGKVIGWKDLVNDESKPYDDDGHGTHCASIAAGAANGWMSGVAPGASLVGVKVLDRNGNGGASEIAAGIDWCTANKQRYGIDVLSLSLGLGRSSFGTDAVSRAVDRASAAGLVVCVAAGNEGSRRYTIGSPAAAASAITVGNMADLGEGGFALADHSSRGPTGDGRIKPDLCAPGVGILAARANTGSYIPSTGSSMACPFVAGVAALMLRGDASLSPADVKRVLKATAVDFGPTGEDVDYGAGRLDAHVAIASVAGQTGNPPEVPAHHRVAGRFAGTAGSDVWTLTVEDTRFPVALTLIMEDETADFDLFLLDSEDEVVAYLEGETRQETISFRPREAGVYKVVVSRYAAPGAYWLDLSGGTSLVLSEQLAFWE